MSVLVLSRRIQSYSSSRIIESFRQRKCDVVGVDPLGCSSVVRVDRQEVLFRGRRLSPDGIVPRLGPGLTEFGLPLLRQFGGVSLNSPEAILRSREKFTALQMMGRCDVPVPATILARCVDDLPLALEILGGAPIIVKSLQGSQGTGVVLLRTAAEARRFISIAWSRKQNVLLQEYIGESRNTDLRLIVVDGRVIAGVRRWARSGEFRSNLHCGGRVTEATLSTGLMSTAVRACRVLGLDVAGVDILESARGPVVLEVNACPGLEGVERCTGIDVAGAIADLGMKMFYGMRPRSQQDREDTALAPDQF